MNTRRFEVDGKMVEVESETHYRIPKGTTVWLVVDGKDEPIVAKRAMVYSADDIKETYVKEYHFHLPQPNKKQAAWLIAKKEDVIEFERHQI